MQSVQGSDNVNYVQSKKKVNEPMLTVHFKNEQFEFPTTVNGYRIGKVVGQGSFGSVYICKSVNCLEEAEGKVIKIVSSTHF